VLAGGGPHVYVGGENNDTAPLRGLGVGWCVGCVWVVGSVTARAVAVRFLLETRGKQVQSLPAA
jgi:hypothetical protein